MEPPVTNIRILNPSRKRLHPGDIFVLQVRDDEFIFGRVVRTDAVMQSMRDVTMIYIYNAFSDDKHKIPELSPKNLLVPPMLTNRLGWSRGYFEVVENRLMSKEDLLPVHCFASFTFPRRYFDEEGRLLDRRYDPCGERGLHSFRTIDDAVSKALGIPLAPD